ncbi:hypothetical protein DFJ63DRAFT_214260 [Scheffersomyces coipomensis]|uniref:uncharacterized protein n=1 Tax=Scheffersomyces coipomensis TaxID=1788519 RepID=UPI00315C8EB5
MLRRILTNRARIRIRNTTIRFNSSKSIISGDSLDYETRKGIISQNPSGYYPPINQLRQKFKGKLLSTRLFRDQFKDEDFTQYEKKLYPQEKFLVEGQIVSIRKSGKSLYFVDIIQSGVRLQFMINKSMITDTDSDFDKVHSQFKKGDYVLGFGYASVSNVGELSLKLSSPLQMLVPCLQEIPNKLEDKGIINSNRVLNYLVNPSVSKTPIIIKSKIIQSIRKFLLDREFLEVQTPILSGFGTGANAQPFTTVANSLSEELVQLRVAPELWLKKLIISGFDRIFEIGNSFRNEGIDASHNPEFTTCEFYQTYINLSDLMRTTEQMIKFVYQDLYHIMDEGVRDELNPLKSFKEYPKFDFVSTLESKTGVKLPCELSSINLIRYLETIGIPIPDNKSPSNLLDVLSSTYLESISLEETYKNVPIFIYNQPSILSPLAKSTMIEYDGGRNYDISLRFELFINGKEYVNAYEEENSPFEQESKFKLQELSKANFNDEEMLIPDWKYIQSMEYGLPPTGGFGCGIDRLAMLFAGVDRIDQVLPFGNLRDVKKQ